MEQNLKDLFKNQPEETETKMTLGHENRFIEKLDKALPIKQKSKRFSYLNIAASVIVLLGLSFGAFQFFKPSNDILPPTKVVETKEIKTMGDFSPKLKKVEDYYLASINLELSKINLTSQNKELVDGYISRLQELGIEYEKLTVELSNNGPSEETLDALINNLKFRLNMLIRLKERLKEFGEDNFEEKNI